LKILGDSKLSKKCQITVPKHVRDLLSLDSGDLVVFVIEEDQILFRRAELIVQAQVETERAGS
jgi:AbrB family looped-hinge helix DNA binding protein